MEVRIPQPWSMRPRNRSGSLGPFFVCEVTVRACERMGSRKNGFKAYVNLAAVIPGKIVQSRDPDRLAEVDRALLRKQESRLAMDRAKREFIAVAVNLAGISFQAAAFLGNGRVWQFELGFIRS